MGPSNQVRRRTDKKKLGERLNNVAKDSWKIQNQQVLWEACFKHLITLGFILIYNSMVSIVKLQV
jgi:hypothetical protein